MKMSLVQWLLLLPAFLLLLACLGLCAWAVSAAPPFVSVVAGWVLAIVGLWFFLVRRRGPGTVSEAGLIGQRSSKDGLL